MKFITLTLFALMAITQAAPVDDLDSCKCWEGYNAVKDENGVVSCDGKLLLHIRSCNEPEPPKCVCTGNVTGILLNSEGTWCSEDKPEGEHKKWECENKEEWAKFHKDYPAEKP